MGRLSLSSLDPELQMVRACSAHLAAGCLPSRASCSLTLRSLLTRAPSASHTCSQMIWTLVVAHIGVVVRL